MAKQEQTILIIEDEPLNINILRHVLETDYHVLVAKNGQQAFRRLAQNTVDLILLDIVMPEMDGYEVCERLKAEENTRHIPVIFITSKQEEKDEERGFLLGAVDYIRKPFSIPIVNARVKTQLQLVASMEKLKSLNALKNKFLGIAAHDLRSPLTGIRGYAEYIRDDFAQMDPHEIKETASFIVKISGMMLSLVNDLLDVSIIESGKLELQLIKQPLVPLIEERVALNTSSAKKKQITLRTTFKDHPILVMDSNRISQVLDNIIMNAIKFSPKHTQIHISVQKTEQYTCVSVQDQGPGLSAQDKTKLFKSFQQLSAKPTAGEKSSGLGLAIVKKIIDVHHGIIEVDSELGAGATFRFMLPNDAAE